MESNSFEKISFSSKYSLTTLSRKQSFKATGCKAQSFSKSTLSILQRVKHGGRIVWKEPLLLFLQCQLAIIPLGTGNDLARVLGWGAFWTKDKSPLDILTQVEQAHVRILDRWVAKGLCLCASIYTLTVQSPASPIDHFPCSVSASLFRRDYLLRIQRGTVPQHCGSPSSPFKDHRAGDSWIYFKGLFSVLLNVKHTYSWERIYSKIRL